jgi:hypothetical protein
MIATQDHAFLPSSHYYNNNLQGIQQFPLYALLNISLSQSLNSFQHHPQLQPHLRYQRFDLDNAQADSTQRFQCLFCQSQALFLSSSFFLYLLCRHFSPSTLTTKSTTITSAMGRVCARICQLADHRLTLSRVDTTRSATPRPTRS